MFSVLKLLVSLSWEKEICDSLKRKELLLYLLLSNSKFFLGVKKYLLEEIQGTLCFPRLKWLSCKAAVFIIIAFLSLIIGLVNLAWVSLSYLIWEVSGATCVSFNLLEINSSSFLLFLSFKKGILSKYSEEYFVT